MRALGVVRSLPDHSLIDRLVRGQAWIPVLGVLLAGIVAMQVEVLKLGTSAGRAIERGSTLQSQNESLQASVAALEDDQRIERLAASTGMVMPPTTVLAFLSAHPAGDTAQAIANIHSPDPAAFAAQLAAQSAAAAAATPTFAAGTTPQTIGATGIASGVAGAQTASPAASEAATSSPASTTSAFTTSTPGPSSSGTVPTSSGTAPTSSAPATSAPATSGSTAVAPGPATGAAALPTTGPTQSGTSTGP